MKFKGTITIHFTGEAEDAQAMETEAMLALDDMLAGQDGKAANLPRLDFDKWEDTEVSVQKMPKYHGIKKAISEMPVNGMLNGGQYLEVFYDIPNDKVITFSHVCLGFNEYTNIEDAKKKQIVSVGFYDNKVSMEKLKYDIEHAIKLSEQLWGMD